MVFYLTRIDYGDPSRLWFPSRIQPRGVFTIHRRCEIIVKETGVSVATMQKVRGWIYVGKCSASFISEDRYLTLDLLDWRILTDEKKLKSFQDTFKTSLEASKSSYSAYFVETRSSMLKEWFELNAE